jgi:hypothetical protein
VAGRSTRSLDLTGNVAANAIINKQITASVKSQLAELRSKSYEELEALPESHTSTIEIARKRVTFTIYRERRANGETLVVVQAHRDRLFGIWASVFVEGFISSASGVKVDAPEESLWEYT